MRPRFAPSRSRGFTLVEILVVLVIVGILLAMAMALTRGITAAQKRSTTAIRLATVDAALIQFVMIKKRLPCPAFGGPAATGIEAGGDTTACDNAQKDGVVPWTTLGISENDATDGWDRRLTYRVGSSLTATNGMDMSACDPAGTNTNPALPTGSSCNPASPAQCSGANLDRCTPPSIFLTTRGLKIQNVPGAILMDPATGTGAAYVVISAGESGGKAYTNAGQLFPDTTSDGTQEAQNYADAALGAYYVDDQVSDVPGFSHFDDLVSRPTVLSVAIKAGLGPRAHN